MGKLKGKLIVAGLVLVLLIGAFAAGYFIMGGSKSGRIISGDVIKQEISEISELAVLRFYYTDAGKFEDTIMLKKWKVPLTTKSFILLYSGEVKLGVEFKDIDVAVNNASKEIKITLPPVKVLSHAIDESTAEPLDASKNIINQIQPGDFLDFLKERKKYVEANYITEALLKEAEETAKKQIGTFVGNFAGVKDEYTVVFN